MCLDHGRRVRVVDGRVEIETVMKNMVGKEGNGKVEVETVERLG